MGKILIVRQKKKTTNKQNKGPTKKISNFQKAAGNNRVLIRNKERKMSWSCTPRPSELNDSVHEEPIKVPLLITLSDGCYAKFPVIILPPISCRLAGVRLAVIDSDFHRGDETILNFATVW